MLDDGSVTYTPAENFSGSDSFIFKVNDGEFDSSPATVEITVAARNNRPLASDATVVIDEDTSTQVSLVGSDIDGDELTFRVAGKPTHGTVSSVEGNIATYTPNADFSGSDSFGFIANDGKRDSIAATVTVTINPVNDAPIPTRLFSTTAQNVPIEIQLIATDADGDALRYEIVGQPASGQLSALSGNRVTYTPGKYYIASDTFVYIASDEVSSSRNARVTVTIEPAVSAPENPGSTIVGDSIEFSWSPVSGAASYSVCYAQQTIANMANCESFYDGHFYDSFSGNSLTVEAPEKGRPYFFRVAANEGSGFVGQMSEEAVSTLKMTLNDSGALFYVDNLDGRDVTDADDSDGALGFSFTKLSVDGDALLADAADWACVKDNVTGLVWENKTADGGVHGKEDTFTWYSSNPRNNGGSPGDLGATDTCSGYDSGKPGTFCNTEYFVSRVNATGFCGRQNWRLPSPDEVLSIVMLSSESMVDSEYFPNQQTYLGDLQTGGMSYWTSAPSRDESNAWAASFSTAYTWYFNSGYISGTSNKTNPKYVRLVSSR